MCGLGFQQWFGFEVELGLGFGLPHFQGVLKVRGVNALINMYVYRLGTYLILCTNIYKQRRRMQWMCCRVHLSFFRYT